MLGGRSGAGRWQVLVFVHATHLYSKVSATLVFGIRIRICQPRRLASAVMRRVSVILDGNVPHLYLMGDTPLLPTNVENITGYTASGEVHHTFTWDRTLSTNTPAKPRENFRWVFFSICPTPALAKPERGINGALHHTLFVCFWHSFIGVIGVSCRKSTFTNAHTVSLPDGTV